PRPRRPGATVAAAWLRGGQAHLAHMGDSRIYLYRQGRLSQQTEDHSVVALLLRSGEITPEEARRHPARHQITRHVGMEGEVYADVRTIQLEPGDRLLLCTDGLTGPLDDERVAALLAEHGDPEAACRALVAAANAAGGADNITALVVDWR
ncbi:MAG: SpoIIE family protein phosphatase, partial [Anaerolineae bacterium]|nr:SpoIIE family protein phosphatase [Anaerolineae bacterium]